MPSLRTIFLLATASLASFTSAIPVGLPVPPADAVNAGDTGKTLLGSTFPLGGRGVLDNNKVIASVLNLGEIEQEKRGVLDNNKVIASILNSGEIEQEKRSVLDNNKVIASILNSGEIEQEKRDVLDNNKVIVSALNFGEIEQEKRGDEPKSLPVILLELEASLQVILKDLSMSSNVT